MNTMVPTGGTEAAGAGAGLARGALAGGRRQDGDAHGRCRFKVGQHYPLWIFPHWPHLRRSISMLALPLDASCEG